jgi:hypothetical protein
VAAGHPSALAWVCICVQDLEPSAFISVADLKEAGSVRDGLPIVLLSYPWLSPAHPDPRRDTLQVVARVLRAYIENVGYDATSARRWGVFCAPLPRPHRSLAFTLPAAAEAHLLGCPVC